MTDTLLRMGLLFSLALPMVAGCGDDDTPAERAGERIEEAGDEIEEATDEVGD